MKCKVVNPFNDNKKGDVIELNDRRYKSELRNGNVVKAETPTYQNKAYKKKTK